MFRSLLTLFIATCSSLPAPCAKPNVLLLLVDDLIATGGTACATVALLRDAGALVVGASFVIDLPDLGGKEKLQAMDVPTRTLIAFEGD